MQVTLPGLPRALRFRARSHGEARDALRGLRRHDLDREASLLAEFLDLLPGPIAQVGHDIDQIDQLAFASRVEPLAVLAQEDVVDAVGIGQGRAHAREEADGPHAGPRAHFPAEPGHDVGTLTGPAAPKSTPSASRAAFLVSSGRGEPWGGVRILRGRPGTRQELAGGIHDLDPDALSGERDDRLGGHEGPSFDVGAHTITPGSGAGRDRL